MVLARVFQLWSHSLYMRHHCFVMQDLSSMLLRRGCVVMPQECAGVTTGMSRAGIETSNTCITNGQH
jgi:hypothetical protein